MDFLKRLRPQKQIPNPHEGKFILCPTASSLYVDTDGTHRDASSDTIAKRDYLWVRDNYSILLPGLMEWCERYRRAVDPVTHAVSPGFDWRSWHNDGLQFAKEIHNKLPREITLRYARPPGDNSGLVEDFDVTQETVDLLLEQLGHVPYDREPVMADCVVVGVKNEDDALCIRFKIKGTYETFTFSLEYDSLDLLKGFLERVVLCEGKPVEWESNHAQNGMYFFPQIIGDVKHMGQLHIYIEGKSEPDFTAYLNTRQFIKSLYRSIMAHINTVDNAAYKGLQSNMIEWYIDDDRYENFPMFKKNPKMAKWLSPAIVQVKDFFAEIYNSINDDEYYQ